MTTTDHELMLGKRDLYANVMYSPDLKEYFSKGLEKTVGIRKVLQKDRAQSEEAAKLKKP